MKKIFKWWYVPVVFLAGVIFLYAGLVGYRIVSSSEANGTELVDNGDNGGFWSNFTSTLGLGSRKLRGEREGRVNVLLVGIPGENNLGPDLTDSLVFASIDVKEKVVSMFSIPRDLYLEVPGFGYSKINSAYSLGKNYQVAGGGMDVLIDTVTQVVGQDIDYYVKIDFDGFVEVVDSLGGIDVVVDEDIYDYLYPDEYGGYQIFALEAGTQHLDGETALKFVRSRQTTSDFDRSKRQQKTIMAMRDAFLDKGLVGGAKIVIQLVDIVSDHLETNMEIWEWERVAKLARDWGTEVTVNMYGFDNSSEGFLVDGNVDGLYVLQPYGGDFEMIHDFVEGIISGENLEFNKSQVNFSVLNATNRVGLAGSFASELEEEGYTVSEIDNASELSDFSVANCKDNKNLTDMYDYLENDWNFEVNKGELESSDKDDCILVLGGDFSIE
ncbi:LCP family protein [Patescibacteria group bacterium]|nr:LCP family protein [Patescibacteria group bacterium]